jgi:PAS domain S-box-containing protein
MARQEGWSALFRTAFKNSRNAMVLLDERRRHVDVNGAYLGLLGYTRGQLIGHPIYEFVVGGPIATPEEWEATLSLGEFTGEAELVHSDGGKVGIQYAAHIEVLTGERLVLFVALSTSRWGRHFRRDVGQTPAESLSTREREVVRLIALGETGPEIAARLHISHDTVRTHARNAMLKIGARSRAHLVAKSLGDGLVLS